MRGARDGANDVAVRFIQPVVRRRARLVRFGERHRRDAVRII